MRCLAQMQSGLIQSPDKLHMCAGDVQTTAGDVQTLEDQGNADVADTLIDDALGQPRSTFLAALHLHTDMAFICTQTRHSSAHKASHPSQCNTLLQ